MAIDMPPMDTPLPEVTPIQIMQEIPESHRDLDVEFQKAINGTSDFFIPQSYVQDQSVKALYEINISEAVRQNLENEKIEFILGNSDGSKIEQIESMSIGEARNNAKNIGFDNIAERNTDLNIRFDKFVDANLEGIKNFDKNYVMENSMGYFPDSDHQNYKELNGVDKLMHIQNTNGGLLKATNRNDLLNKEIDGLFEQRSAITLGESFKPSGEQSASVKFNGDEVKSDVSGMDYSKPLSTIENIDSSVKSRNENRKIGSDNIYKAEMRPSNPK